MNTRCFVDVDGHIWSINHKGESNFPDDIELTDGTVRILGVKDCLGPGREITEEYQLWPSLTSLAMVLEQDISPKHTQNDIYAVGSKPPGF
ncbi:hypothetical protein [Teredinibacter purpureus]|uniref:hypothetical protein n=1 Tax=Teredinibacter purpureus TaxID=2731756 RepID=UPI0005F894C7|nr:hypothetical protein [Teredinibacter purpureus]